MSLGTFDAAPLPGSPLVDKACLEAAP
jgi:hypothetical protein